MALLIQIGYIWHHLISSGYILELFIMFSSAMLVTCAHEATTKVKIIDFGIAAKCEPEKNTSGFKGKVAPKITRITLQTKLYSTSQAPLWQGHF